VKNKKQLRPINDGQDGELKI